MDELIKEIKDLQEKLDRRTEVENEAARLITEGKFAEACKLLATI